MGVGKDKCSHCNIKRTKEGHDGCLGTVIGVMNACCGHGKTQEAYVQFFDQYCIRGEDALKVQEILKENSKGYSVDKDRYIEIFGKRMKIHKNEIWKNS